MKLKKTAIAILTGLTLFALPLVASAKQPVFPSITGLKDINGSKVTFLTMSGIVKNLSIQRTTVDDSTGKLVRSTLKFTNGIESPTGNLIIPDNSGHFIEFADTIVFGDFTLFLSLSKLLAPTGNQAFGPVEFVLEKTGVSNGFTEVIQGAAEVKISITNTNKGVLVVNKFQPYLAFKNNSTASGITTTFYDANLSMSATPKTFQLYTTEPMF